MTTQQTKVDWDQPIEAVHEDGRVVAGKAYAPDVDGDRCFDPMLDDMYRLFGANGLPFKPCGWRIRNIVQPEATTPSPELTALCREMLAYDNGGPNWSLPRELRDRLAAELEPLDGDLIEARECVAKVYEDAGRNDLAAMTRQGKQDNRLRVQSALPARRRALAKAGK